MMSRDDLLDACHLLAAKVGLIRARLDDAQQHWPPLLAAMAMVELSELAARAERLRETLQEGSRPAVSRDSGIVRRGGRG